MRQCTSAFAHSYPTGQRDTADLGEQVAHLPERDGLPVSGFHPVHEVEHIAGRVAGVAVEHALPEVHRAAGMLVVMKRTMDLGLVPLPDQCKAVLGEDRAEVRAAL